MKKTNSKQLKNRILLLTYIYRSLPTIYLKTAAGDDEEKKKIHWIVNNLVKQGYVLQKKTKPVEFIFIHLSQKGYNYVVKKILKNPEKPFYRHKESRSLLKPIFNHSFLNFAFLWHFHKKTPSFLTPNIRLYEDSDINNCKVLFSYKGKDVLISPDTIIYLPDTQKQDFRKAIFVENDTGRETYKTIYQKMIEYLALAEDGMDKNKLSSITLYFIFLSRRRMKRLFTDRDGFLRYFDLYNKTNRGLEVRMRFLLKTLQSGRFKIYLSTYNHEEPQSPYSFRKYDLTKYLLEKEAAWKNFLS